MYMKSGAEWGHVPEGYKNTYEYVKETYGKPGTEWGYKDFVPMWKAEKWNPDRWASLFENAGADFAGPCAVHHDGFELWDTDYDNWNSVDRGPKVNVVKKMIEAVRDHGMKTVVTVHHCFHNEFFEPARKLCPEGVDANNPKYYGLYSRPQKTPEGTPGPENWYWSKYVGKVKELINRFRPDMIWTEAGIVEHGCPESYRQEMLAYYFNTAENWGKEVVITHKRDDLPDFCSPLDIEAGALEQPRLRRWQTDTPLGKDWCWSWIPDVGRKPVNTFVDLIVSNVSKNGLTLISVAPKPNGNLPEAQVEGLRKLGDWMDVNKPALYATQPAPFVEGGADSFRAGPIRFTRKGPYLYAIDLEKPGAPVTIPGVTAVEGSEIRMLGSDKPLDWHQEGENLVIEEVPDPLPCDYAWSFKIQVSAKAVDETPPAPFELTSPSNNTQITDNTPTLEWESTSDNDSGLDHYEVWIDGRNVENVPAGTTSYTTSELSEGVHTWWATAVDEAGNKCGADEFSFEVKKQVEQARFELSNLSLSKSEIKPGESTTVTVSVKNTGGETGSHTVELSIDGKDKTQEVTLDPGASENVEFRVSENEEGTYEVSIGGLTETFNVEKPGKPRGGGGLPLIPTVAGVVVVIGVIGAVIYWRR